jgi:hypothetical protein
MNRETSIQVTAVLLILLFGYWIYKKRQQSEDDINRLQMMSVLSNMKQRSPTADTMLPYSTLTPRYPDFYNMEIPLTVPKSTKYVVYWATDGPAWDQRVLSPTMAFNQFDNSGVAEVNPVSDDTDVAVLRVSTPSAMAECDKVVAPKVYYRLLDINGTMSPVSSISIPSNAELQVGRQVFHSTDYAYLA